MVRLWLDNYMNTTTTTTTPAAFVVGNSYSFDFTGDGDDHTVGYTVLARTAKFITISDKHETKRVGVRVYDGVETCSPWGSFSMSPILRAVA